MLRALETRIPPPLVGAVCAFLIFGLDRAFAGLRFDIPFREALTAAVALPGLALEGWAVAGFIRARTTINPLAPERSAVLVTSGPYRITRNPMYLGMALLLLAWTIWLSQPLGLAGLGLFVAWITRFQIIPEERALRGLFGAQYKAFCARVRRWI